ncbi:MAG: ATP-grasp domain-containing protein [Planctomycetota bacterium]
MAKLSRNYVQLDYSNADRLSDFVKARGFDYLVPGCTDVSYRVCSEIGEGIFPEIDKPGNTQAIHSKTEFRGTAIDLGLSVPRVLSLKEAVGVEAVIVKPVDSFSGRGITVLHAPGTDQLDAAFELACRASRIGQAIVEEYVSGQLFSHSAFVWNGKVVADFVVQEDCTTNPFTVDTSRVASHFPTEMIESLRKDVCRLVSSLGLSNGLMHTQFIAEEGCYWIIEVARRCPGDIYSLLIEFSTGYPYAASYAAPFIGKSPVPRGEDNIQERIIRHTVTSGNAVSLWGLRFTMPVHVRLFVPLATSGDMIEPSPYGRVGIFFFRSPSDDEQEQLYRRLVDRELYSFS